MNTRASLYWSVRRELWENRSILLAPLALAALVLLAFLFNVPELLARWRGLASLDAAKQRYLVVLPFGLAASVILVTGWIVGIFYAVDALNGERRDRSILFWKSMPVSDLATVLAKAVVVLFIVPAVASAVTLATQAAMFLAAAATLAWNGLGVAATLWTPVPWVQTTLALLYGVCVHALWFAPLYGWLMLVSVWARRAALLWAMLPLFAAAAFERIAFGTQFVAAFLQYRISGAMAHAFAPDPMRHAITELAQLEPLRFLATPGLWLGLVFAAACLAAAIRLRRYRDPY